ncbi:ABC transporter permease [Conexibacter sp. CPCC 206217]|uniref:ABC transporter permease n=1 Tax=Conexibacter sp. CPCC 206217 TaxID=3064574 RepID=UPI00271656BC|nr:ABC transporter permease [Conexibacter sp. CPCC 206217]MDO8213557.1 ABC transporter permease [Conexibacter sp. CPCC 206217]
MTELTDTTPSPAAVDPRRPDGPARAAGRDWRLFFERYGTLVFFAALIAYFAIRAPSGTFLTTNNLSNVLTNSATLAIIAGGVTVVLIVGEFDLSIAATAMVADILAAKLGVTHGWVFLSFVFAVLLGSVIGTVNGIVVTKLRVNAFIATLAMGLFVLNGLGLLLTETGTISTGLPPSFDSLGDTQILGINATILIAVAVLALLAAILHLTDVGRWIHAVGGNANAARLSGVNVGRTRMIAFIVSGTCCGVAGVVIATTTNIGSLQSEGTLLLDAFTAAFLGSATFRQGRFNIAGTIVGVLALALLTNGMTLTSVPMEWQAIVKGVLLILAVAASGLLRRS